jgi:hypothetical protein
MSAKVLKITISMLNNFLTIGFRAKNSIERVKEIIPNKLLFFSYLTFDLNFKVRLGAILLILD